MKYVITNCETYLAKTPKNEFRQTDKVEDAFVFDEYNKAWNVIKTLPKWLKDEDYFPKQIDKECHVEKKSKAETSIEESKLGRVAFPVEDSKWLATLKKNLTIVDETLGNARRMYSNVCSELNSVNMEIEDIEHAIEFTNANAVRAIYLETELKKARRRRRELRDAKKLLRQVLNFKFENWGTGELQDTLDWMSNRAYAPRIRKDLFK